MIDPVKMPGTRSLILRESKLRLGDPSEDDTDADDAQPRICTDVPCLIIFALYLGIMLHIYLYARDAGNIDKLTHGIDWQGNVCGLAPSVIDKPLLYWCATDAGTVTDSICVDSCPTSSETHHMCPGEPVRKQVKSPPKEDGEYTVTVTLERTVMSVADEPTTSFMDMYCLPQKNLDMLVKVLSKGQLSSASQQVVVALHGIYESRGFLIFMACVAVIMSVVFLYVLSMCVVPIIYFIITFVGVLFFAPAVYCLWMAFHEQRNFYVAMSAQNAKHYALITSGVLFVLWSVYCCIIFCSRNAIGVTIKTVRACCRTLMALPTIVMAPLVQVILKSVLLVVLVHGLAWVASTGEIVPSASAWDTAAGVSVSGVGRTIKLKPFQWQYLMFFAFGSVWLHEVVSAMGQMAVAHAVVIFTLNRDESNQITPVTAGYCNSFTYHLGTLAFGGFVIGVLGVLSAICSFIAKQAHNPDGSVNTAAKVACLACTCCLGCLKTVMEMTNELAYVDTVIQGSSYTKAASNVVVMFAKNPETVALVTGMTKAIRALGTLTIGGLGTYFAHWMLRSEWVLGSIDDVLKGSYMSSALYSSSVLGSTIASALICFGVGGAFMVSFDQIGDTLAYCMIWRKNCGVDDDVAYEAFKDPEDDEDAT